MICCYILECVLRFWRLCGLLVPKSFVTCCYILEYVLRFWRLCRLLVLKSLSCTGKVLSFRECQWEKSLPLLCPRVCIEWESCCLLKSVYMEVSLNVKVVNFPFNLLGMSSASTIRLSAIFTCIGWFYFIFFLVSFKTVLKWKQNKTKILLAFLKSFYMFWWKTKRD